MVEQNGTLANEIASRIRETIVTGELKPGARLVEARLARELGTSRGPIREAARLLESEGLLTFDPNRGFSARQITLRELVEVYDVRVAVERHAAAKAAERRNPLLIRQLSELSAEIIEAIEANETQRHVDADFRFHKLIVEGTANRRLLRIYADLEMELRLIFRMVGRVEPDWRGQLDTHEPVIQAIAQGTPLEAANQIEAHIRLYWDELLRQIHETSTIPLTESF